MTLWLKEGDTSIKFSHRVTVANRRRSFIQSVEVNVVSHVGKQEVKGVVIYYYEKKLKRKRSGGLPWGS